MEPFEKQSEEIEISPNNPQFYEHVISSLQTKTDISPKTPQQAISALLREEFDDLSKRLEKTAIQEGCSVRNIYKSKMLANYLIGDNGELSMDLVQYARDEMKRYLYSLAPGREHDAKRDEHILQVLELLLRDKELVRLLSNLSRPYSNRLADDIIRETLSVSSQSSITDTHVKRACLAAWFTTLRQSLGSCFATAPAILIHEEQPHLFLKDLDAMMNTGFIKRTFGGIEYAAPMSYTWGNGDLKKPFLLQKDLKLNEMQI